MLRIHVFNTGWFFMPEKHLFLGGGYARRTLPVLCFVVEHPQGLLVFDAGLQPVFPLNAQRNIRGPSNYPIVFYSAADMHLTAQMAVAGLHPQDVAWIAVSHLHDDHTGSLGAFPHALLLLARQEPLPAQLAHSSMSPGAVQHHTGLKTVLVDFPAGDSLSVDDVAQGRYGVDPIGDRTLFLVPTFGHTAGHQSLLVSLPDGPVLLAGDAALVRENYARPVAIPNTQYPNAAWRSIIGLHALHRNARRALVLPSHDPEVLSLPARDTVVVHAPHTLPPASLA